MYIASSFEPYALSDMFGEPVITVAAGSSVSMTKTCRGGTGRTGRVGDPHVGAGLRERRELRAGAGGRRDVEHAADVETLAERGDQRAAEVALIERERREVGSSWSRWSARRSA